MRTVIFLGLIAISASLGEIAKALGAKEIKLDDKTMNFLAIVILVSIVMDIIEFISKVAK